MYYKSDTNDYKDFLEKIDQHRSKTVYARITALKFDESPIEQIEGRVSQGNINIDGNSSVRRTCSLTLVAQNFDFNDYHWGLNTKFKLEIGLENFVDETMPKIIWFNQGIYILSMFNVNHSTNALNITLQGKDKMCLLNGEIGGALESSVDFGVIEEEAENGDITYTKISLQNIIKNMIHQYGKEPYNNIIINDLDTLGLELLEYRYTTPMYLYYKWPQDEKGEYYLDTNTSPVYTNMVLETNNTQFFIDDENGNKVPIKLSELTEEHLDILVDPLINEMNNPKPVYDEQGQPYIFAKIEYGETGGYRTTKLVYAGDLIAAAGDSITSVLDKIKNMLGSFEYFYDINGKFVFQKKRSFVNTLWTPINNSDDNKEYIENIYNAYPITYTFNSSNLISAFQDNPNLTNVRNDYSIWGERKTTENATVPIHLRYAIDKKPTFYRSYKGDRIFSIEKKEEWEILEEIREEVILEVMDKISKYDKTPNPNGLPEDWWTVHEWADYYKQLTGETPHGRISDYATVCTVLDLNKYFPATSKWKQNYGGSSGNGTSAIHKWPQNSKNKWEQTPIFLFDIYQNDPELSIESYEHNPAHKAGPNWKDAVPADGCSHKYDHFLNQYSKGIVSYFYKPVIPDAVITEEILKRIENMIVSKVKNYNCDWREIIYQMGMDYLQYAYDDDGTPNEEFLITVAKNNPDLFPTGITGYEQYYTDLEGFWRQLYYPYIQQLKDIKLEEEDKEKTKELNDVEIDIYKLENILIPSQQKEIEDIEKEIIKQENNIKEYEKKIEQEKLKDKPSYIYIQNCEKNINKCKEKIKDLQVSLSEAQYKLLQLQNNLNEYNSIKDNYCFDKNSQFLYWRKAVYQNPEVLNFWFDFLDLDGELNQFNVQSIGIRSKVVNDTNIKAIYFRETPDVIFTKDVSKVEDRLSGYKYIQIENIESMFTISSQGKSAKSLLEELLYQHGYCIETVSITAVPIYYLEPNTRISLSDKRTSIEGDYIINKITIPLNYNGMMTISASKAAQSIL